MAAHERMRAQVRHRDSAPRGEAAPPRSASAPDADLREALAAAAADAGCELLHLEFKGGTLRLILDRPEGGISLNDCEAVSRLVSPLLDAHDFGRGRYTLEVSSPGLDRQLYGPRDFERFVGHPVRVTYRSEEGRKRTFSGRLELFDPAGDGAIEVFDAEIDGPLRIPLPRLNLARLEIEI